MSLWIPTSILSLSFITGESVTHHTEFPLTPFTTSRAAFLAVQLPLLGMARSSTSPTPSSISKLFVFLTSPLKDASNHYCSNT